ncbi:MAG: hypothetical protein ACRD9R_06140 [Pyrinomonadaceae bacterium]
MKTRTAVLATLIFLATLQTATEQARVSGAVSQTGSAALTVANGFANQPGTANPLTGRTVALLKESFEQFLQRKGMFQGLPSSNVKVSPLLAWASSCKTHPPICQQALHEVQGVVAAFVKMDANGRVTLPGVPPGPYYLFTFTAYHNQPLIWDLRVDLRPGASSVVLDQRNTAALTAEQARAGTSAGGVAQSEGGTTATNNNVGPATARRPGGPKNGVLNLRAISESRQPVTRTIFYLLDDDFESILQRAGFQPQTLLGKQQSRLSTFEFTFRLKAVSSVMEKELSGLEKLLGGSAGMEGFLGDSALPEDVEEQYANGLKALSEHTVATIKTDSYGRAVFPRLPAGVYYVYGTASEFVKTGTRGTVTGNTVTLNDTGHQNATIWNLKVAVKPGQNSVILTPDNAAFTGN